MCTWLRTGLLLIIFSSCKNQKQEIVSVIPGSKKNPVVVHHTDTSKIATDTATAAPRLYPIMGYRFIVTGDFNGDGLADTLTEHYFSHKEGKETNKFYEGVEYDELVDIIVEKAAYAFLSSSNPAIPDLQIADRSQLLGVAFLKNEGDLNGDGTDEISYIIDWADWSSLNTCHVMTFKNKKWQQLLSFGIWDWQLPNLPQAVSSYGLFGIESKEAVPENEKKQNQQLQKELDAFPGFITKISNNKILVRHMGKDASIDTSLINLRKVKHIAGFD